MKQTQIRYLIGDATTPTGEGTKIICHVCNDIGGWGAGFVMAVSKKWLEPERAYREWFKNRAENDFGLGAVQIVQVLPDLWIANMIGQHGLHRQGGKPPIRYEAIEACLSKVAESAREKQASVHMPRIGCGLAGGKWEAIEPIIQKTLSTNGIPVFVYDLG